MLKLLVATTLYPNSQQPRHGVFIETRLHQLQQTGEVAASAVIAPVPWFPLTGKRFGQYADYAKVPKHEVWQGVEVFHPRYLVIPKIGMLLTPLFLFLSFWLCARRLQTQGYHFDLIDAHYFYPDGVAAAWLAKCLRLPLVISARGTDLNLIPEYPLPRKMILWAAKKAHAIITVSAALRARFADIGGDPSQVMVLRNGVDLARFSYQEKPSCQEKPPVSAPFHMLSVGNLTKLKGHDLIIRSLVQLPEAQLTIIGQGEEASRLHALVDELALNNRVKFVNNVPQAELGKWYAQADVLVLASSREGWPNVLLEAMACGTPVIATRVGGVPEIVSKDSVGIVIDERSSDAIAQAVRQLHMRALDRQTVRLYAEQFAWPEVADAQVHLYKKVVAEYA